MLAIVTGQNICTAKNHRKFFLKMCSFLQNSELFSQNEPFFLKSTDNQSIWEKNAHFEKKKRILEKRTHFEKKFPMIFGSVHIPYWILARCSGVGCLYMCSEEYQSMYSPHGHICWGQNHRIEVKNECNGYTIPIFKKIKSP